MSSSRDAVSANLLDPITEELAEFERRLEATVREDLGPMAEAMNHIVKAGGKRLRPALVILSSQVGTADVDHMYSLATAIEFIHTATLIHDDVIDHASTRRGTPTIHEVFGPDPAIIVGDYYFAKGANLMASIGRASIDEAISRSVMAVCKGELLQMTGKYRYDQTLEQYYQTIESKTAALLSASTFCGALIGHVSDEGVAALERYGHSLGMAFQIADDVLDYIATEETVGKPVGADLRQGTVTLPLMYALSDPATTSDLRAILGKTTLSDGDFVNVVTLVRNSDGVEKAQSRAIEFAEKARRELTILPQSRARDMLTGFCDYVVTRGV